MDLDPSGRCKFETFRKTELFAEGESVLAALLGVVDLLSVSAHTTATFPRAPFRT
jgi:hypothetical protein